MIMMFVQPPQDALNWWDTPVHVVIIMVYSRFTARCRTMSRAVGILTYRWTLNSYLRLKVLWIIASGGVAETQLYFGNELRPLHGTGRHGWLAEARVRQTACRVGAENFPDSHPKRL